MFKRALVVSAAAAVSLFGFAGGAGTAHASDPVGALVGNVRPPTGGSCGTGRGVVIDVGTTRVKACVATVSCTRPDIGIGISINGGAPVRVCIDPYNFIGA